MLIGTAPIRVLAAALSGYVLGTVPSASIVSRAVGGPDPTSVGSGNPGAANVASSVGAVAGFVVLAADIAKGAAAGVVGRRILGPHGADLASTAAVLGHCHPAWPGASGGKGVAASVGQVLVTLPAYFPVDVAVAVATAAVPGWKQRALSATGVSSVVWIAASVLAWRRGRPDPAGLASTWSLPLGAALSSAIIAERFLAAERAR